MTDQTLLEPIELRLEEFEQMSDQGGEPGHSH
jgi:hypothetical protein